MSFFHWDNLLCMFTSNQKIGKISDEQSIFRDWNWLVLYIIHRDKMLIKLEILVYWKAKIWYQFCKYINIPYILFNFDAGYIISVFNMIFMCKVRILCQRYDCVTDWVTMDMVVSIGSGEATVLFLTLAGVVMLSFVPLAK